MLPRPLGISLCTCVLLGFALAMPARAITLPANFVAENAVPNVAFDIPTRIAFLPDGRMLVAEKRGRVWMVDHGVRAATPLWQREDEVLNEDDRGLLAIAVDPHYYQNHYLYFLYTVDPDSDGVDDNDDAFGRLTRYTVDFTDSSTVDYSTRTILLGVDWAHGAPSGSPSHSEGDLIWGRDGSLFVSFGDGAQFIVADAGGWDPNLFLPGRVDPSQDIGAFRAQSIGSLNGKILRIDPATGQGYPSNPFWNGDPASVQSRVWCYGFRNPFRFTRRPGTGFTDPAAGNPGTLYIGDVGWVNWEEQDVARTGGKNFGWPCWEGLAPNTDYEAATPANHGCSSIGQGDNVGELTLPQVAYPHDDPSHSTPPGIVGNTSIGGVFYSAAFYPPQYQNQYFIGDFGTRWIKLATVDDDDHIVSVTDFANDADGPVDIETDPITGDIFYVAILAGEVRRIRWTGPVAGNLPPVAVANATPTSGIAPLPVAFSSEGSNDPDFGAMTYTWNFGDGSGSTLPNPIHTYIKGADYTAVLTVSDDRGGVTRDTLLISTIGTGVWPTTTVLDNFDRPDNSIGPEWLGQVDGLMVNGHRVTTTCCDAMGVWGGGTFGANQEAYYLFDEVSTGTEGLMLKVQGDDWSSGYLEVRYDGGAQQVSLFSYTPDAGYVGMGSFPATFENGDQIGARAWSTGLVQVFRNGVLVGTGSNAAWPFNAQGGRIGLILDSAPPTLVDDFGGGDIVINTPPHAIEISPVDSTFYVAGDTASFVGTATDAQQSAASLAYEWRVDLHHNNHIHPSVFTALGPTAKFVTANHEDGTGVWYEIELRVTDAGGLADTARVGIFPEIDLEPSPVTLIPAYPGTTTPNEYRFKIYNHGRMPAPISRWRMVAGPLTLAEGTLTLAPLDSAVVDTILAPVLGAGNTTLRVVVDTLGAVVETNETNNAHAQPLTVVDGGSTVDAPAPGRPTVLALSAARPSPSSGAVSFALDLPDPARVSVSVHDLLGRRVWSEPEREYEPGRWTLRWDGRTSAGGQAPTGLYMARVTIDGRPWVRRILRLR